MFTKIGGVLAGIAVLAGLAAIAGAYYFAPEMYSPDFNRASLKPYGLLFWQGAGLVFLGVVLGVLCEISRKLTKPS
ncbi:hypothetical protein [Salipiger mangrovisoli]|uniref:Uncharacterized protein n=1 Tax=Salipiger mangrovisoli TaxID=2865933 RepID=A0ABR9WX22_9RHOB|nr:hypothetical protein [Salipiger mangrovisoli]MBE9635797.1 hypothetical protein [Salipiger mangrovisoli]